MATVSINIHNGDNAMTIMVNGKDIRIKRLVLGPYETNCYILVCTKTQHSLVVDAPADVASIIEALQSTKPQYILLTHNHFDHTGALVSLRTSLKVPLAAHAADSSMLKPPPEMFLKDGNTISLGQLNIEVLHTSGHTPGSLCFKISKYLIAGDTIFPGGPGKTRSSESFKEIIESITSKILPLAEDTAIYPGHGDSTTVKKSKEEYANFISRKHSDGLCGDVLWLSA